MMAVEPIKILLVEDQPADVRLTREVLKQGKVANELYVAEDGEKAMKFLSQEGEYEGSPRPDLVILDLNLPRMDGKEVLQAIKGDPALLEIPVLMLTTSAAEQDILDAYKHHVNAYITKPIDLDEFVRVVSSIEQFWLSIVRLPDGLEYPGGGQG
jgi:CheY-like chemotaxis protein